MGKPGPKKGTVSYPDRQNRYRREREATLTAIRELTRQGLGVREIGKRIGLSGARVHQLRKKYLPGELIKTEWNRSA